MNWKFGDRKTAPEGEISIYVSPIEAVRIPEAFMSNQPGAETSFLEFVLRQNEGSMSVPRMEQVELRIRYLLDYKWRSTRRGGITPTPPFIPCVGDKTIIPPILCQFDQFMAPITSTETWVRYIVSYTRAVPR